jgi:two-component sensor histidine kinase
VQLLLREINHRSKNMLSIVSAIAHQTVRDDNFLRPFVSRIMALAANQDLLIKNEWKRVLLGELVQSQLSHLQPLIESRISVCGPPTLVSAAASQTLAMALHELATNAIKYGALSTANGRIDITWSTTAAAGDGAQFTMTWQEKGGPLVTEPGRSGFGATVLTRVTTTSLGADTSLDFAPSGLVWRLACPIGNVTGALNDPSNREASRLVRLAI